MQVNWRVRFKNPTFIFQMVLAVLTPILAYLGMSFAEVTTWGTLGELIAQAYSNPYLLSLVLISVYNAVTDPTVKGLSDSKQALGYERPKER